MGDRGWIYLGLGLLLLTAAGKAEEGEKEECVYQFTSESNGQTGVFQSADFPNYYKANIRCQYQFMGRPYERVQINFTTFQINGYFKDCITDYIDVYPAIADSNHNILDTQLHGRYCGEDIDYIPYLIMSTGPTLVFVFITNNDNKTARGFQGHFTFVNSTLDSMGQRESNPHCGWRIASTDQPSGVITAPDYPAAYLDSWECFYIFTGQPGERVKLTFTDFDLFEGGSHCPFDQVTIYDGDDTDSSPIIMVKCGTLEPFTVFSTYNTLYVKFKTTAGRFYPDEYWNLAKSERTQMRGFSATYEFNSAFVSIDSLPLSLTHKHVMGTECDMKILSQGLSNGTISSPGYPLEYPQGVRCVYFLFGMENVDAREKVVLVFQKFNIPKNDAQCKKKGFLSVYFYGTNPQIDAPDRYFCGAEAPQPLISRRGSQLSLVFDSRGAVRGEGFLANYHFAVDYAIAGTPVSSSGELYGTECHFRYTSAGHGKKGFINSPRYPSKYPESITCTYELLLRPRELVMLSFDNFNIIETRDTHGLCQGDYLQSTSLLAGGRLSPGGRLCGDLYPGPIISEWGARSLKVTFKANSANESTGYRARYEYLDSPSRFTEECGGNFTADAPGFIMTPRFPLKYQIKTICDWYIYAHLPGGRIQITFVEFDIEGRQSDGCQGAVLRVYSSSSDYEVTHELCGSDANLQPIISESNFIRLRFLSSSKSLGKRGFRISYNELSAPAPTGSTGDPLLLIYVIAGVGGAFLIIILMSICLCIRFSRAASKKKQSKQYAMTSSRLGALTTSTGPDTESLFGNITNGNGSPPGHHHSHPMYTADSLPSEYRFHIGDNASQISSHYVSNHGNHSGLFTGPERHYVPEKDGNGYHQPGTGGRRTWMSAGLDYDLNSCLTSL